LTGLFRGGRLALHLLYGMFMAIFYPHMNRARQAGLLKAWSAHLLGILNIRTRIYGQPPLHGGGGALIVANHVSWLDIFVLNAVHPSVFIAKSEVRGWPLVGWLCRRSGTIFIERAMRQDTASVMRRVSAMLEKGGCVGLFPEGTTTDGKQVGHFHSALIQPAIDAGAILYPAALCYRDGAGGASSATAFTGNTTLAQSVFRILKCKRHNVWVAFTPALATVNENRRALARAAQDAITLELKNTLSRVQECEAGIAPHLCCYRSGQTLLDPAQNQMAE
jgi:1-acyl-sn-glycerol-3-phosphate acyltransferase